MCCFTFRIIWIIREKLEDLLYLMVFGVLRFMNGFYKRKYEVCSVGKVCKSDNVLKLEDKIYNYCTNREKRVKFIKNFVGNFTNGWFYRRDENYEDASYDVDKLF